MNLTSEAVEKPVETVNNYLYIMEFETIITGMQSIFPQISKQIVVVLSQN